MQTSICQRRNYCIVERIARGCGERTVIAKGHIASGHTEDQVVGGIVDADVLIKVNHQYEVRRIGGFWQQTCRDARPNDALNVLVSEYVRHTVDKCCSHKSTTANTILTQYIHEAALQE